MATASFILELRQRGGWYRVFYHSSLNPRKMTPDQIKKKAAEALKVLDPSNTSASDEEKTKAWLFLKEALLILYP